jgi:hypothetical protein
MYILYTVMKNQFIKKIIWLNFGIFVASAISFIGICSGISIKELVFVFVLFYSPV